MRRPVLESGEASIILYNSKAPEGTTALDLIRSMDRQVYRLRRALQAEGKLVTSVYKLAHGEGDVKIVARWQVLGEKRTKHWRRSNAGRLALAQERENAGRATSQEGVQENPSNDHGNSNTGEGKEVSP